MRFVGPLADVGGFYASRRGAMASSVAGSLRRELHRLMRGRLCCWARFWGLASASFWRALRGAGGGGGGAWGSLVVFVLLGRRVEWPPRRVDRLALRLGFVGE